MSITVPLQGEILAALPPEVVQALGLKPGSALMFEIEDGGRVLLCARGASPDKPGTASQGRAPGKSRSPALPKPKPGSRPASIQELNEEITGEPAAESGPTGVHDRTLVPKPALKGGRPGKTVTFAELAGTFPGMKPGVRPATQQDIDNAVKRGVASSSTRPDL